MLLLSPQEVERLLEADELLAALEDGFKALSAGELDVPPRNQAVAPKGVLFAMPAYMPRLDISVKLVSIFHASTPSHHAIVALFDAGSGAPIALMSGEHITAMRTAAAATLSIRHLARRDARSVAIVGAGVQGGAHLRMLGTLSGIEDVRIASRTPAHARALAARDARARAVDSVEDAVRDADVVCLCTSSPGPVVERPWLKAGVHVTSVGYRPPGGELAREIIESGSLFVESRRAFEAPPVGSAELQGLAPDRGTELGQVLLQEKPGRRSATETTIYKSMGHAMEDLVAANLVYRKAVRLKIGTTAEL